MTRCLCQPVAAGCEICSSQFLECVLYNYRRIAVCHFHLFWYILNVRRRRRRWQRCSCFCTLLPDCFIVNELGSVSSEIVYIRCEWFCEYEEERVNLKSLLSNEPHRMINTFCYFRNHFFFASSFALSMQMRATEFLSCVSSGDWR